VSAAPIGPGALSLLVDPPVIPVCINQDEALLGPLYMPGQSVCPECLDYWLRVNFYDYDHASRVHTPRAELLQLIAETIARWSTGLAQWGPANLPQTGAQSLRGADGRVARHAVFPRRDCPRCGELSCEPLPLRVHCSPWTGIVNRLELTAGQSAGAFRATATWAAPLPVEGARGHLKRQESYGRGRTASEAESGCIGEALERYSLIYRGDERLMRRVAMSHIDALHPDDIQLFSDAQYRERLQWNATVDENFHVPERFDVHAPVDWLEARELGGEQHTRFVAAACCLMWYEFRPGEPEFARADTIGCASGVTFDDALSRALLEWVERDATAIWWDNMLRRPGVWVESFDSPDLNAVAAGLRAIGRDLFLLDCTTDIGIPAYVAVAPRHDGSEPLIAGAADLSARTAAYRAASEVGQVWYEAKRSGGLLPALHTWLLKETTSARPHLEPVRLVDAPREHESVARLDRPARPVWMFIVDRLEAVGLRAYAVDHSRADVSLRTVRAVVPGLRHIWNRRAPGRLYDVPVKMGWLDRPKAETDLNPIRCTL